jgi:hypothetical protein
LRSVRARSPKAVGALFYQASHPRLLTDQPVGRVTRRVGRVLRAIRRTRALCLNLFEHITGNPEHHSARHRRWYGSRCP